MKLSKAYRTIVSSIPFHAAIKPVMVSQPHPVSNIRMNSDRMVVQRFHHDFWLDNNTAYIAAKEKSDLSEDDFNREWLNANYNKFQEYNSKTYKLHFMELLLSFRTPAIVERFQKS
jgi:hypothetical protein